MLSHNQSSAAVQFSFVTLASLLVISAGYTVRWVRTKNKLPPGPKGTPFVGIRLFDKGLKDFEEWGKKYGDIVYLNAFAQGGMVLVNSREVAVELFDRRGSEYKHRPKLIAVNDFLTKGLFLPSINADDLWRGMRRVGHECMNKSAVTRYHDIQQKEALLFVENLLLDSTNWYKEVHRSTISGVLSALYDIPPTLSTDDLLITKLNEFDKLILVAGYPGSYLVEYFTWMRYLPEMIAPWKRRANAIYDEYSTLFLKLFKDVEQRLSDGDSMPGMVGHSIRQRERIGLTDMEAAWIPAGFSNGGFGTAETMLWFFLAMVHYPEKQRKCQEELDAVVGQSRVPVFGDRENLPYMRATVRELLRWRPIAPVGIPRVTDKDEWYQGRLIPKGTSCYAHIWFMNRDKSVYGPDVDDFNPDRFIEEDGKLLPAIADTKDEGHHTYGFGPRICPGRYYANDTMFITFAEILWAATISPAIDEESGRPLLPDPLDTIGVTIRPRPFPCVVKPRFAGALEMVSRTKDLLG